MVEFKNQKGVTVYLGMNVRGSDMYCKLINLRMWYMGPIVIDREG